MHRPPATYQVDGAAIRTRRTELGLSQADVARKARISRPYLSQLEAGERNTVRPPTYARLCVALRLLLAPNEEHQREDPNACQGTPRPHPD
jgi:transcriptional regulator with XRE-family HTH domain